MVFILYSMERINDLRKPTAVIRDREFKMKILFYISLRKNIEGNDLFLNLKSFGPGVIK